MMLVPLPLLLLQKKHSIALRKMKMKIISFIPSLAVSMMIRILLYKVILIIIIIL